MAEGSTKKEADKELDGYKDQVRKGIYVPDSKVPLFSEVAREWIDFKKPNLRETTCEVYDGHVRNHFNELNRLKANQITIATVEKFITARQDEGMNIGTLRKILVVLGQILKFAVRRHYHYYNPLRDAERPKEQTQVSEDDPQRHDSMHILTPPQINAFLGQETAPKYKMLFTLAIFTGARQGELLGLKWSDVDWKNRQIRIRRTYTKGRFFPPKTRASRRKIDVAPKVLTALKRWKLTCPNNELDLVFPNEAGEPINYSNMVQRHFLPGLRAAGLTRIRFHDLRHTYASILIENGENIKYIQTQMGHSSPTVTLNVYAHLMKPTNQEAACRLENTIFGATGHKMVTKTKKGSRPMTVTP
jgi:integrase